MDNLSQLLNADFLQRIAIIGGIIAGAFIVGRLATFLLIDVLFKRLTRRTRTTLDDMLAEAARRPLYFIFVLIGFNIAVGQLEGLSETLRNSIKDVLLVVVVVVGAVMAYRLLVDILTWYAKGVAQRTETRFDEQFVGFIRRVLQIAMVILVAIMILGSLDVDVTGLVAGLGVGSLAIALAAQTLLEDTFAGFAIMVDRPFVVGDRILLPKRIGGFYGSWGDVMDIKLRITTVRNTDGVMLTIPNSQLTKDVMINFSHQDSPPLRVRIRVGLARRWSNVEHAMRIVSEILEAHPSVSNDPRPPQVIIRELRDYDVLIEARYYVEVARQLRPVNSEVQGLILQRFEAEDVELSYPTELALRKPTESLPQSGVGGDSPG
jgi:MscS family membrane protein